MNIQPNPLLLSLDWPDEVSILYESYFPINNDNGEPYLQGYPTDLPLWVAFSFNQNIPIMPYIVKSFPDDIGRLSYKWPTSITVLPEDFASPYGTFPPYDPTKDLSYITMISFRSDKGANYFAFADWWVTYNLITKWENKFPETYLPLVAPFEPQKIANFNKRFILRYNTVWAYFGYTENQLPLANKYAEYLLSDEGYQQLKTITLHMDWNGYTYIDRETKSYGKKEVRKAPPPKRAFKKKPSQGRTRPTPKTEEQHQTSSADTQSAAKKKAYSRIISRYR